MVDLKMFQQQQKDPRHRFHYDLLKIFVIVNSIISNYYKKRVAILKTKEIVVHDKNNISKNLCLCHVALDTKFNRQREMHIFSFLYYC